MLSYLPPKPPFLPGPFELLSHLDARMPVSARQLAVEPWLNRMFAQPITDDEFEPFEGRTVRLQLSDQPWGLTLGFWKQRLRVVDDPQPEVTIRGTLKAFLTLAQRQQDPDALFFRRELVIEGDTELGLAVKNLLDAQEWVALPRWLMGRPR